MKKLFVSLALLIFSLPLVVNAQETAMDRFYEKYAAEKNFTGVSVSPEMFEMLASMEVSDSTGKVEEAHKMMSQLTGLKMLMYETKEGEEPFGLIEKAHKALKIKNYTEMMTVQDDGETIKFYIKKSGDKVSELLMTLEGEGQEMVLDITGNIDMKTVAELGQTMNMHGMSNLSKMKNHHDDDDD
jgi:negative regulator of sigma E activity